MGEDRTVVRLPNIFRIPVTAVAQGGDSLGFGLDSLLSPALRLFANSSNTPFIPEQGIIGQLTNLLKTEDSFTKRQQITDIINGIRAYFYMPDPDKPDTNAGQIRLVVSEDRTLAFLTLTPPRGQGNIPTINTVRETLSQAGIVYGIDMEAVEKGLRRVREDNDVVWRTIAA